ncbi:MAG: zinc ribbon domain-containing protein [Kofleriaceae bacterium]|nr:zinc ribbon domain-containing protein [Kofleriaceae bacterium]MCB9573342.1 zinc ribbon domain-containing protein [Kofleriaceae bacterium]
MAATLTPALAPCARCGATIEVGDVRCPVCALVLVAPPDGNARTRVLVARCGTCAAALAYDARVGAPTCGFCGAATAVEELPDPPEQAAWFARASVDAAAARAALGRWQGSLGWFRPGDLRDRSRIDELRLTWWPAWVFDARARVSWTGDSDAGAHEARWAPWAGQTEMTFAELAVPASRALRDDETRALIGSYDLGDGGVDAPAADDGVVEQFEVQRSAARERVLAAAQATAAARVSAELMPGRRRRNVHVELVLRDLRTRRVALPAYVLAYRYRGRLYRAVVSGQDAGRVIGRAPWSIARIAAAAAAAATLLTVIAALAWWFGR